jgi:hypothetical protein
MNALIEAADSSAGRGRIGPPVVPAPVLADAVSLELTEAVTVLVAVEPPAPLVTVPPVLEPAVTGVEPVAPVAVALSALSLHPSKG